MKTFLFNLKVKLIKFLAGKDTYAINGYFVVEGEHMWKKLVIIGDTTTVEFKRDSTITVDSVLTK